MYNFLNRPYLRNTGKILHIYLRIYKLQFHVFNQHLLSTALNTVVKRGRYLVVSNSVNRGSVYRLKMKPVVFQYGKRWFL